jgi:uncharacterized protein YndB with AHSA1/START domain
MRALHATAHVEAPPGAVYTVFTDVELLGRWFPGRPAIEAATGPLDRPGTRYTMRFNAIVEARCSVLEAEPPQLHVRSFSRSPLPVRGIAAMRFRPSPGGGTAIELTGGWKLPLGLERLVPASLGYRQSELELRCFAELLQELNGPPTGRA